MGARAALMVLLMSVGARAEQWADEPEIPAPFRPAPRPRQFGVTAGVQLGSAYDANEGPVPGVQLGLRIRLTPHLALSLLATYEAASYANFAGSLSGGVLQISTAHFLHGVVRLELFTVSAVRWMLVPELAVGLYAGVGQGFEGIKSNTSFQGGFHFGMTRLRPSGWWFPVFVEVGASWLAVVFNGEALLSPPFAKIAAGIGF